MSEYIKKFKPPSLNGSDKRRGVRFVETQPQVDFLNQPLNVGDIVAFGTRGLVLCKVIGMYSRIYPDGGNRPPTVRTLVAIISHSYQDYFTRQSVGSHELVKLTPEQYEATVKKALLEA